MKCDGICLSGDRSPVVLQITPRNFPAEFESGCPREVSKIVARCLKKNQSERYQTASELLSDVQSVIAGRKNTIAASGKTFGFFGKKEDKTVIQNSLTNYETPSAEYVSNDYAPSEKIERPKNSLPYGLIAAAASAAVIVLFVLVGAGVYFMKETDENPGKVIASDGKNTGNATAIVVPNAAARQIKIDVDEGKAQVYRGSEAIGSTPLDLNVKDGEKVNLILRRDGFEDKTVQFEAVGGKRVYTFSLKQK